jgi:UDP-2,3-diacylglucosamine hydrolase
MKLGIIAGNRLFPIILAKNIKQSFKDSYLVAICFKGETSPAISRIANKTYWLPAGNLSQLRKTIQKENLDSWTMAGQISPYRIFQKHKWDAELTQLLETIGDTRPHTVFRAIIDHLERDAGITFKDSTAYMKNQLADKGTMTHVPTHDEHTKDIDFGTKLISAFVELDIGQTVVIKQKSVVAAEALEGTDRTIVRGYKTAGTQCTVLKFSKHDQDLRFDVPLVGIKTLTLLKRIRAAALVLEEGKVIILEKEKFISLAARWKIPVIGKEKIHPSQTA